MIAEFAGDVVCEFQVVDHLILGELEIKPGQFDCLGRWSRTIRAIGNLVSAETGVLT